MGWFWPLHPLPLHSLKQLAFTSIHIIEQEDLRTGSWINTSLVCFISLIRKRIIQQSRKASVDGILETLLKPDGYLGAKIDNEKYFIISKRTVIRLAREKEVIMKVLFHDQLLTNPKPMLKQIQLTFYILDPTSKFPALPGLLGTSSILLKNYNISVLIMFIFLHNMCFLPLSSVKALALCRLVFNHLSILIYIYMSVTWKSTWMLFKIWRKISKLIYVFINLQFMLFKNEYFEERKFVPSRW